jgi:hypothetical protein
MVIGVTLGNEVSRARILFKYAYDAGLIEQPLRYGQSFKRPSRKAKRGRKQEAVYRKGLGLYTLRRTFQTIGDAARDPIATRAIMGHAEADDDMSAACREGVDDDRLKAVTDHVRQWLFPEESKAGSEPAKSEATEEKPAAPSVAETQPQP